MKGNLTDSKSKFPPLLHLTFILQQSVDQLLLQQVGVGLSQTRLMSDLSATFAKNQRTLAAELKQTEANVSRQLQVMKKAGLVTIEKNKKDARQRDVKLTIKGSELYKLAEQQLRSHSVVKRLSIQLENIDLS